MRILVTGANRPLGAQIARELAGMGLDVLATCRAEREPDPRLDGASVERATLELGSASDLAGIAASLDRAVLTARLDVAAPAAARLAQQGIERGLVFSSHNVSIVGPDPVYDRLRAAERAMAKAAPGWTLLRPTMIYGHAADGNLSKLMRLCARWPVLPVPGSGRALQQPVHFEDLARVAAGLVVSDEPRQGPLAIGGPETLPHRELVEKVRAASGRRPPIPPVPVSPILALSGLLAATPLARVLSPAQLRRVDLDKHVAAPSSLPEGLAPRISLEEGLARLAEELGLTRPGR